MPAMQTKDLGLIEYDERQMITFPDGIPGFEEFRQYVLLRIDEQLPFLYMQSVDEPDLRFIVTNPFNFEPNYEFELNDAVKTKLSIENTDDVRVYSLVTIPDDHVQKATINLLGPIIVNEKKQRASQIILHSSNYNMKHPLFPSGTSLEGSEQ